MYFKAFNKNNGAFKMPEIKADTQQQAMDRAIAYYNAEYMHDVIYHRYIKDVEVEKIEKPYEITPEQKDELQKLCDGLWKLREALEGDLSTSSIQYIDDDINLIEAAIFGKNEECHEEYQGEKLTYLEAKFILVVRLTNTMNATPEWDSASVGVKYLENYKKA